MRPPLVNYVTFNRLGLTERNLRSILETPEDFEMHIVDSNSRDNTWEYIESLDDPRIKSKTRFPLNNGPILPANFNLLKRKPDQYFITIDSDVYIKTLNWISCFMEVFNTFPEAGLLGVRKVKPFPDYMPPTIERTLNGISYLQLRDGFVDGTLDFVPGHCQCLRPELINLLGYWSEENGYGDAEVCIRINNYTPFKAGFVKTIDIDMTQKIPCDECNAKKWCKLDKADTTCFSMRDKFYINESAAKEFYKKYKDFFQELEQGKRTVYCASILDEESMKNHLYHKEWAEEVFNYFIKNAN